MKTSTATILGLIYAASEAALAFKRRAKAGESRGADRGSLGLGPYRIVRHPSYTGALMAFLGLALCLANWASLAVLLVQIFLVFRWRVHVEEAALIDALGEPYRDYMKRTKRLIPGVY